MKTFLFAATLVAISTVSSLGSIANAAPAVPCEDVLATFNDALSKAKLNDADAKAVAELKAKGEERCTAEDDRRADGFFNDALAIITKK